MLARTLRSVFALSAIASIFSFTSIGSTGCAATSQTDAEGGDQEPAAHTSEAITAGTWVAVHPGTAISTLAFVGGNENGHDLYVCRAAFNGGMHPGKVVGTACSFAYGGAERWAGDFELLLKPRYQDYQWTGASPTTMPSDPLPGGWENGHTLYVCRASYNGLHPGKVVANNCNFSWGGRELTTDRFDVIVQPCGHAGQACCGGSKACPGNSASDDQTLQCNAGRCESCGDVGLKCCTLNHWYCPGRVAGQNSQSIQCVNNQCVSSSGGGGGGPTYCSKKIHCTFDCGYGPVAAGDYCDYNDALLHAGAGCLPFCG